MPKFIYTILIFDVAVWGIIVKFVFDNKPDLIANVSLFLILLLIALSLTFSIPIYFYFYKKSPTFTNLRFIFRKSLKYGFYIGLCVCLLFVLKFLHVLTVLNAFLFVVLYFTVLYTLVRNYKR